MYATSGLWRILDFGSLPALPVMMVQQDVRTKITDYFFQGSDFHKASATLRHVALPEGT